MKLVITGASGELGRKVTALLIAAGRATDLILVSRNPAALAEAAAAGATLPGLSRLWQAPSACCSSAAWPLADAECSIARPSPLLSALA